MAKRATPDLPDQLASQGRPVLARLGSLDRPVIRAARVRQATHQPRQARPELLVPRVPQVLRLVRLDLPALALPGSLVRPEPMA